MPDQLTDQVKSLILNEVKSINETQQNSIFKLELYSNLALYTLAAAWAILLVFIGGSVWTYSAIESTITEKATKIATKQISNIDDLSTAVNLGYTGDYNGAINTMTELIIKMTDEENKKYISKEFKINVVKNSLWLISEAGITPNGEWLGQELWKLINEKQDIKAIIQEIDNNSDWGLQFHFASIEAKIISFKDKKESIEKRLINAYVLSQIKNQKADIAYSLTLFYLTSNKIDKAKQCFTEAALINPAEYSIDDWNKYKSSYINSEIFSAWSKIDSDFNKTDNELTNKLHSLVMDMIKSPLEKASCFNW
ncbi:MAG: hypothetical protein PHE17_11830 [Thiothrix sp.]|uniref:hypothetical protein n=1 Tax=Thiothrix sp. TaxID=1032 RepID=UPI00262EDDCA|nr:hypothetical protein [Thiothrix sp.]MDD5393698.1 hypothetical protein [Thiothrix sp.]